MKNDLILERLILQSSHPEILQGLLVEQGHKTDDEEVDDLVDEMGGGSDTGDPDTGDLEAIKGLRKPVEKALKGLNGLIQVVGKRINNFEESDFKGHMTGLLEWFTQQIEVIKGDMDNLENNMSQAMQKVGAADAAKQYGGLIEQIDELKTGVHNVTHLSKAAVATLAEIVLSGMYHENETYKDTPMQDLLEAEKDYDPAKVVKQMTKAMQAEVVKPKKKGGFMSMVKSFFKMGGTDIQVGPLGDESMSTEDLVEIAMQMTPLQVGKAAEALMDMVKASDDVEQQIEDVEEEVRDELEDVVVDAEENPEGDPEEEPEDDLDPEEAVEEVEEELENAAEEAAKSEDPPAIAIAKALDAWAAGLSPTSQKSLQAKNRLGSLKDRVNTSLENAASAVEAEVTQAVTDWRGDHEETLIKSKRFAKKNFDQLTSLIPQIAGALLKKTNESGTPLTKQAIKKSVYRYLDKRFKADRVLVESSRWQEIAGIE